MFIHELKWHRVLRGDGFFKYISNVTGAFRCWHHLTPTDGEAHKTDNALAASHVTEYIQEGKKCHQEQELFVFFLFFFRLQCILYTHFTFTSQQSGHQQWQTFKSHPKILFILCVFIVGKVFKQLIHSANEGQEASEFEIGRQKIT